MGFFTRREKVKESPPSSKPRTRTRSKHHSSSPSSKPRDTHESIRNDALPIRPPPRPATAHQDSRQLALPASDEHRHEHACGQVVVNHNYYFSGQPIPLEPSYRSFSLPYGNSGKLNQSPANKSMVNLATHNNSLSKWYDQTTNLVTSSINACDEVAARLNNVLTLIDGEHMNGTETDLFKCHQSSAPSREDLRRHHEHKGRRRRTSNERQHDRNRYKAVDEETQTKEKCAATDTAAQVVRGNYFSKVEMYANSKSPTKTQPFAVYVPTWPLLCLAAQYSLAVYERPAGREAEAHVSSDWRTGTKAMCIKSVPMDHMHTIVFAIRGTASFMDWAVNLNTAPASPREFLDDEGNLCHAGFLSVARKMVKPVAARLRELLKEDPSRSRYSLLITGHSAGGAVASLLYAHMLAATKKAESELNILTGSFKRVHCVTFGTPPISLLPIMKPERKALKNSVFLSFVNEGDPVTRADKAYVKSLLELLGQPAPDTKHRLKEMKSLSHLKSKASHARLEGRPVWPVPVCTLSNAGRIVVLRSAKSSDGAPKDRMTIRDRLDEGVVASVCTDDQLRGLIWGDPVAHLMKLYAGRIEMMAVKAVTVRGK
ncbi:Phospholipase-like protein [Emericellopsis cladophorae]|uniref:Phospholipase-like protein n=1 Tax=Emericellopsis cladophorae TaxID=2686198 RepID=A0A9P9Y0A7_9HYPO|nr:Phospholipase-like protein [Emericellopsis cladophorae]KAI6781152.1 Phospholipase-like protein [Emericellopsis cladophorae]